MNEPTRPVTLVDLIDQLQEAPEPDPVSMAPQTWGWLVLGLIVLALVVLAIARAVRVQRANAYRRAASQELRAAADDPTAISRILRRAAMVAAPRAEVAALAGDDWLRFLDAHWKRDAFTTGAGRVLAHGAYDGSPADPALTKIAQDWLRKHRVRGAR